MIYTNSIDIIKQINVKKTRGKQAQKALVMALNRGFADELKNESEKARPFAKASLAQKLCVEGHFDLELCNKTLDTLCAALFDETHCAAPEQSEELASFKKPPHFMFTKYILPLIILAALAIIAAFVWYKVFTQKTDPLLPEFETEQSFQSNNEIPYLRRQEIPYSPLD
jgi:hypothetical protein